MSPSAAHLTSRSIQLTLVPNVRAVVPMSFIRFIPFRIHHPHSCTQTLDCRFNDIQTLVIPLTYKYATIHTHPMYFQHSQAFIQDMDGDSFRVYDKERKAEDDTYQLKRKIG